MRPKVLDTLRDPGPETLYSISTTKRGFSFCGFTVIVVT